MTVVLKVLAVLLLTLPPSAYVAGRIVGPPELSVYGQSVTMVPPPPQAPQPPRIGPARPDRSPSTSLAGVREERTPTRHRAEADAAATHKREHRRDAVRGEGARADGRVKPDTDSPRPSQPRPETRGPDQRDRADEPLVARVPEPVEPSPPDGSVEVHGDSVEVPEAVEVVRGDESVAEPGDGFNDAGEGSVVIEGREPW